MVSVLLDLVRGEAESQVSSSVKIKENGCVQSPQHSPHMAGIQSMTLAVL